MGPVASIGQPISTLFVPVPVPSRAVSQPSEARLIANRSVLRPKISFSFWAIPQKFDQNYEEGETRSRI